MPNSIPSQDSIFEILTLAKLEHELNALLAIADMLDGIFIAVKLLQLENVEDAMLDVPFEITTSVIDRCVFENILGNVLSQTYCGIVIFFKLLQLENAESPIFVILLRITKVERASHPENVSCPMLVRLFGIVTLERPWQLRNALSRILDTPSGISTLPFLP